MDMLFVRGDGVILVRCNPKTYLLIVKSNSFVIDDHRYLPLSEHNRSLSDDGREVGERHRRLVGGRKVVLEQNPYTRTAGGSINKRTSSDIRQIPTPKHQHKRDSQVRSYLRTNTNRRQVTT